ncbi:MAG: type 4a pilus biogenesis protein PilO [Nitrospirae bacterium]|nr:type 4a pilus biogenesis protein PilO [Nitrospirota bacterium]MBI3594347.1 type 4a pilus biogenesis protein PilO [Nitrospirota bacterium]
MTTLAELTQRIGLKPGSWVNKGIKDPVIQGVVLTIIFLAIGGTLMSQKSNELIHLKKDVTANRELLTQKEKHLFFLRDETKNINARLQKKSLAGGQLTANERKMSSVLEKTALLAAGRKVEMVSFRPESVIEGEKDNLLTVKIKVKTDFNELKEYISRLKHFPSPIKIDSVKIDTLENETPMVYGDLVVMTRIMKEKNEK